jgi:hypothetical protein
MFGFKAKPSIFDLPFPKTKARVLMALAFLKEPGTELFSFVDHDSIAGRF